MPEKLKNNERGDELEQQLRKVTHEKEELQEKCSELESQLEDARDELSLMKTQYETLNKLYQKSKGGIRNKKENSQTVSTVKSASCKLDC